MTSQHRHSSYDLASREYAQFDALPAAALDELMALGFSNAETMLVDILSDEDVKQIEAFATRWGYSHASDAYDDENVYDEATETFEVYDSRIRCYKPAASDS